MPSRSSESGEAGGRRAAVLALLKEAADPLSIVDIAGRLDVHPNTVRFHLKTLVETGQVERSEAVCRTPGRPPQLFRAAAGMDPTGPRQYLLLAEVLADALAPDPDPSGRAADAGRAWGHKQAAATTIDPAQGARESVDRLVGLLDDLGFAPERGAGDDLAQVRLRHCPFLELTPRRSEIVCPIHLGLMQGALEAWGAPVAVEGLDAFVEPDLCVAHLAALGVS